MNSTVTRILELKFMVNTAGFDAGIRRVLNGINNVRQAMGTLGKTGINISNSFNSNVTGSFNKAAAASRNLSNSVHHTSKSFSGLFKETSGGLRVFGSGGMFMRGIALVRNHLLLLAFALAGVIRTMKSTVAASVEMTNSLIGLGSVAKNTGSDVNTAKQAAMDLASSGLLTVNEAAQGLKNLMATGMSIDKATELMNRLTDAAAFNRQGTLELGQAVVGATQGFKNQLSMLLDNAGITRNLSNMQEEYAKSLDTTAGKLSEAQKYEAARLGILKDAALFTGNASLLTEQYSGKVSKLSVSLFNLKAIIGDTLIPVLTELATGFTGVFAEATKYFKINQDIIALKIKENFLPLVDSLIKSTVTMGKATLALSDFIARNKELLYGLVALKLVIPYIKLVAYIKDITLALGGLYTMTKSLGFVSALTVAFGPATPVLLGISAAIAVVTGALMLLKKSQKDVFDEARKANSQDMQRLRLISEHTGLLRQQRNAELDLVRQKIASGDASKDLITREAQLVTQLEILEGQTKRVNFELEKTKLLQTDIAMSETATAINKPKYKAVGDRPSMSTLYGSSSFNEFPSGDVIISMQNKLKPLLDSLNGGLVAKVIGISPEDQAGWKSAEQEVIAEMMKITSYGQKYMKDFSKDENTQLNEMINYYKTILSFVKERIDVEVAGNKDTTKTTDEGNDARRRWLELLQKIRNETNEITAKGMGPYESAVAQAVSRTTEWANSLKDVKLSTEEIAMTQQVLRDYYNEAVGKAELDAGLRYLKFVEEATEKAKNAIDAVQKKINEGKVAGRQEGIGLLEDIIGKSAETKFTDYQRNVQEVIRTQYRLNDAFKEGKITALEFANGLKELEYQLEVLRRQNLVDTATQFRDMFRQLGDAWVDVQFNIKQEERDTIDQLRKELERGSIDQAEYAARVAHAHEVAAVRTKNAWNMAGRGIAESMFNYLSQIVMQTYIASKSISTALSAAFNPAAIALGLGMAIIGTAVTAGANKAMPNYSEPSYQDIYPGGGSAEQRKRYGSLAQASPIYLSITPTVSIEGNQIWIAAGSVESFESEVSDLMKQTMQAAIDNQEIDLTGVNPR